MKTNNQILVPIDFSEKSMLAFEQAKHLAKITNSDIMLLNVVQLDSKTFSFIHAIFSDLEKDLMRQRIETGVWEKLNALIESNKGFGINIKAMIANGKPYEKILELSKSLNCNYIIIGANDAESDKEARVLGTNASRIVRLSEIPVLTVNNKILKELNTVILPLDLSKETQQKVAKAIKIAKYTNAKIRMVSALLTDDKEVIERLTIQMGVVQKFILDNYGNVSADFVFGNKETDTLAGLIMKYAQDKNGDLIVIMTQQENNWLKLFVGTTAMDIIYNSPIPVLSAVPKELTTSSFN